MDHRSAVLPAEYGWILLAIFSVLWIFLGWLWGRKAKNMDGFMVAGRNVGLALGMATAMATWVTSNTTMVAPEFALRFGVIGMIAYSSAALGLVFFAPMATRIRQLMPHGYTAGDFIRLRYGKIAWVLFLIISLFYCLTWLISMTMAGGLFLNAIAGIPYQHGMTIILAVCVIYTIFGGLYAVIGTDYIQSLIILIGVVILGFIVFNRIDFDATYNELAEFQPALLMLIAPAAVMAFFNNLLFGFGEIFHNNVWWSRAFAMRKGVPGKAFLFGGLFWLPIPVAVGFIALSAGVLDINIPDPNQAGPIIAAELLGVGGAIVVFIVIFCSIASSIDSLLAATSDLITEDVYRKGFCSKATDGQLRRASISIILLLGLFAWFIALPNVGTLATTLFYAGPLVGSAIWPVVAGLYWRQTNPWAVVAAMVFGSILGLIAYEYWAWYVASVVGAAISMTITIVGTWLFPRDFDWSELAEPDLAIKEK
ncbi:MAG: sodium:solute symporter family protein [Opitutales bacterium]|nr:sodium:solute symporter family protein [Opitutales bacterium]MCH8540804.1 sodium:solute symporter family protein [Opitutales bacterium]